MKNMTTEIRKILPSQMQDIYPDSKIKKFLFSLPQWGWRLGLGPIVGRYIMIITHTGRKSGSPHQTAVEYHTINGMKYVPCAFGIKSDWYRNILANPRVTIQTSGGTEQMVAKRVTEDNELVTVIETVLSRNPTLMNWYLESLGITPSRGDILAHKENIIFLRFDPSSETTPRGLEVDLAWIWPMILLWLWLTRPFRRKSRK